MSKLHTNIKNIRMMRGFSQKELGERLHKSANAISNWEKGATSPDVDMLEGLCKILEVTPNQIYGWDACPELEHYLQEKAQMICDMDELMRQRAEIDAKIREYAQSLRRKSEKYYSNDL